MNYREKKNAPAEKCIPGTDENILPRSPEQHYENQYQCH